MTALLVLALPITLVTMAFAFLGRVVELRLDTGAVIGVTVGVVLLGVDFGLLALAVGAASGSRGLALGVAGGIATASYVLSSLAPAVDWIWPLRPAQKSVTP